MGLDFLTWLELVDAFVLVVGDSCGFSLVCRDNARTGSRYLRLRHRETGVKCVVRLSDHRPGRDIGKRGFSVRRRATGRLRSLRGFLASVAAAGSVRAGASQGIGADAGCPDNGPGTTLAPILGRRVLISGR